MASSSIGSSNSEKRLMKAVQEYLRQNSGSGVDAIVLAINNASLERKEESMRLEPQVTSLAMTTSDLCIEVKDLRDDIRKYETLLNNLILFQIDPARIDDVLERLGLNKAFNSMGIEWKPLFGHILAAFRKQEDYVLPSHATDGCHELFREKVKDVVHDLVGLRPCVSKIDGGDYVVRNHKEHASRWPCE